MTAKVSDETYKELSQRAYDLEDPIEIEIQYKNSFETWEVEDSVSLPTGFDAKIYMRGDDIVISYRGTEGGDPLGRGKDDLLTDAINIAGKVKPDGYLNQFSLGLKMAQDVKKKYPNANISLTGHSLGGAIASYVGAMEDVEAVTYNAPSVIDALPKNVRKKVESGIFDEKIINYIHPKDSVGAGAFSPERHIGSAYYIGSRYEVENAENIENPLWRFYDSAFPWNTNYHALTNFNFDEDGNIISPVLTDAHTLKELWKSPRYGAGTIGQTIQLTPESLLSHADALKKRCESVEKIYHATKESLLSYSHIQETAGIEDVVQASLQNFYHWYGEETWELENGLRQTVKTFLEADRLHE